MTLADAFVHRTAAYRLDWGLPTRLGSRAFATRQRAAELGTAFIPAGPQRALTPQRARKSPMFVSQAYCRNGRAWLRDRLEISRQRIAK